MAYVLAEGELELSTNLSLPPHAQRGYSLYQADPAIFYSDEDRSLGLNAVNGQTRIDALIRHPLNVTVEYPETGKVMNQSIGHIFPVCDPQNFSSPKLNIQYSLGDVHGIRNHAQANFLTDAETGVTVPCKNEKTSCTSLISILCQFVN